MNIQESGQMYLETILVLSQQKSTVRSVDVAQESGYSKPSVSRAMGILKGKGLIDVDADGHITLTTMGREIAEEIYERHRILTDVLCRMGVDEKTASEDACRIEHYISNETFGKIKEHYLKNK